MLKSLINARSYCKEDVSNIVGYAEAAADNSQYWVCHHRLETHNSDGERRLVNISSAELKALGMYYNRPASELIFVTHKVHNNWHKSRKGTGSGKVYGPKYGKKGTPEYEEGWRKACKEAGLRRRGTIHLTAEQIENVKAGIKARGGNPNKGKHYYNNGVKELRAFECPEGFKPGRLPYSEEFIAKVKASSQGRTWKLIDGKRVYSKVRGFVKCDYSEERKQIN